MNDLPDGWATATIGELLTFKYGKGLPGEKRDAAGIVPVYGSNGTVGRHSSAVTGGITIVVGRKGSVGEVHLSPEPCWPIDTTYYIDEFPADLPPKYWALFLQSLQLGKNEKSSAIPGISRDDIYRLAVRVPPLAEQHRIVAKLEQLLSRVDACRQRRDKIPNLLKRFRQSVLAAACSGQLTADWRDLYASSQPTARADEADLPLQVATAHSKSRSTQQGPPDIPASWRWTKLETLIESMRSGSTAVPQLGPTKLPILRSSSVRPGLVDLDDVKYLQPPGPAGEEHYLRDGDILFTRLSGSLEYVANCAVVRGLGAKRLLYPDRLFCAKARSQLNPAYCEFVFNSPLIRDKIKQAAKSSAGHQRVSMSDIREQLIPLPPAKEQEELARRVGALHQLADRIEARYERARGYADKLTQSLLAKAFRGELVPTEAELARCEGRNYEPASVLLQRIRSRRANGSPANDDERPGPAHRVRKRR